MKVKNKCLAGIHKKTGVVEVIATLTMNAEHFDDHLKEIEKEGCYCVVADREKAKEAWGLKIDSPIDIA